MLCCNSKMTKDLYRLPQYTKQDGKSGVKNMGKEKTFTEQGNWTLPTWGTEGTKSKRLRDNQEIILVNGDLVHNSLVIPYEYYQGVKGPIHYILDLIEEHFPESIFVALRSNSPDEDFSTRTPGLFRSEPLYIKDRNDCYNPVKKVVNSYQTNKAESHRKKHGLQEKGMSLLVQDATQTTISCGCFSDIGELGILTFTNPENWLEAMQRPSLKKLRVDLEGRIVTGKSSTYDEMIAQRYRRLASALPEIPKKGWEIEFVETEKGFYVVQTTPIEKKERFKVQDKDNSVFNTHEVLGTGEFNADGVVYAPPIYNARRLVEFDKDHKDYCLVTDHIGISRTKPDGEKISLQNILSYALNAKIILDLDNSHRILAPHVEQYMRECRVACSGTFRHPFNNQIPEFSGLQYSPSRIRVQADEVEQESCVEFPEGLKPFIKLREN